jgi:hypothetical protein
VRFKAAVRTQKEKIMSGAKRMMEEQEQKRSSAISIAIEAGVLGRCEFHDDVVFEGNEDITEAYKLGNTKFTHGELDNVFSDRKDMTDVINEVVKDHPGEECPYCAKIRDED